MGETTPNPIQDLVAQARQGIAQEISVKAEQLDQLEQSLVGLRDHQNKLMEEIERQLDEFHDHRKKLQEEIERQLGEFRDHRKKLQEEIARQLNHLSETSMRELRGQHKKLEEAIGQQLDNLEKYEPPPPVVPLDKLLNSVRNLITATLPEQVLEVLTEEAEQMEVRSAVFDVRGKAAWGAAARGFADLPPKVFRSLAVPLNQDGPFRQVFETGGQVDANAAQFKKNRNILDKLKPGQEDQILLLPIRSAGSVSAIVYMDTGGKKAPMPDDALKILSEFAGAQLDRLMALSGGVATEAGVEEPAEEEHEPVAEPEAAEAEPTRAEIPQQAAQAEAGAEAATSKAVEEVSPPPPTPEPPAEAPLQAAPPSAAGVDLSQLSEEEQKYHKDAKRFAKLLISEIELYNKPKMADGRKNKDLYKRLKSDIDRSRQTFQKRFSKPVGNHVDYFHEELVRLLANNDISVLGPEYPGPMA